MNRTRMFLLASVALVLSVVVTFLTYRLLRERLQPVEDTTSVVVTNQRLALGSRLEAANLRIVSWPKAAVPTGSGPDPAAFVGRGVIVPLEANEPILEGKLAPKEAGAGMTTAIPDGMRAVSIRVNDVIGVAGFVVPGSRVDVILSGSPNPQSGGVEVAKIILENVQVLAAGQNIDQDMNGKPQAVQVVTLLVTPEDSQRLALASTEGRMQLALRNPLDTESPNPPLVQRASLYTGSSAPVAPPAAAPAAPRVRRVVAPLPPPPPPAPLPPPVVERKLQVQVIQGNASQTVTFDQQSEQPQ